MGMHRRNNKFGQCREIRRAGCSALKRARMDEEELRPIRWSGFEPMPKDKRSILASYELVHRNPDFVCALRWGLMYSDR